MKKYFGVAIVHLLLATMGIASNAEESESRGYNLSMAGALINDWCGRQWQASGYITIHACNYELAQQYNFAISSVHFENCAVASQGDIVQIADCMVLRFNAWANQELKEPR